MLIVVGNGFVVGVAGKITTWTNTRRIMAIKKDFDQFLIEVDLDGDRVLRFELGNGSWAHALRLLETVTRHILKNMIEPKPHDHEVT